MQTFTASSISAANSFEKLIQSLTQFENAAASIFRFDTPEQSTSLVANQKALFSFWPMREKQIASTFSLASFANSEAFLAFWGHHFSRNPLA